MASSDNTPYEKIGKNEPVSIADQIPFDIPDSWEWVRFGNAVINHDSKRRPVTKSDRSTSKGTYDYYGATGAIDRVDDYIFDGTYLMIGEDGGNFFTDRDNSFIASGKFWANNHVHVVEPIGIDIYYLKHFLDSLNLANMGLINGIAVPKLNQANMNSILVPLPPIEEQIRIVNEIAKLTPLIEEYSESYVTLEKLNNDFPEQLKKSILQQAVQGKLVPQDPNDEPASVLLEKIRAEKERLIKEGKIKRDKNESVIFRRDNSHYEKQGSIERCIDDGLPFDIPETWCWIHLNNVSISELGKTMDKAKNTGNPKPYLCSINVYWDGINLEKVKTALFEDEELDKYRLRKDDLLICEGGDVGRSAIWENEDEMYYQNALHRVRFYGKIDPNYFLLALEFYKMDGTITEHAKGMTIKHLVQGSLNEMYFPLPPLEEQHRIVEKYNILKRRIHHLTL